MNMRRIGLLSGEGLIIKQNSLIKELPSKGIKEFCPSNSWIQKKQIESKLEEKFNFINSERIEKSNNISVAEWIPHLGKARVLKKVGKHWETIGHHQDNDDWLLPEEVIFLVENCELQLLLNKTLASIEDCYALLLEEKFCSLDEYRVYSYLSRAGLIVVRHAPSVNITAYEKQVNLDSVLQKRKRSPLHTFQSELSNGEESEGEVTIIEVENEALSKSKNVQENILNKKIKNNDIMEIIELDDDTDPCPLAPEIIETSDDDSNDIVCISSPSYISAVQSRLWYPRTHESLRRSMDKIIDLCNEELSDEIEELNLNKLDLIRVSTGEVLSHLPSASKAVSVIQSPDIRLLPKNIEPKYSEYKVNLNIRSDAHPSDTLEQGYSIIPENSFTSPQSSPEFMNNPLFRKAEEMQVMAMNMIQTASTLMSVLTSENPNELWNLVDTRCHNISSFDSRSHSMSLYDTRCHNMPPYFPRINSYQQNRPHYRYPRRNFRFIRKNYHERRYRRNYLRRPFESNRVSRHSRHTDNNINTNTEVCSSEIKMEVVVLSDEEETVCESNSTELSKNEKREVSDSKRTCKKLKTEKSDLDSYGKLKEILPSSELKLNFEIDDKTEVVKTSEVSDNLDKNIKEENNVSSYSFSFVEPSNITQIAIVDNSPKLLSSSQSCSNLNSIKAETEEKNYLNESLKSGQFNANSLLEENIRDQKSFNESIIDNTYSHKKEEDCIQIIPDAQDNMGKLQKGSSLQSNIVKGNDSNRVKNFDSKCPFEEKITCWEDYKNNGEAFMDDDTDTLLKFEDCSIVYGDVLKALQIFQSGGMAKNANKFRIIYDVYLPQANFKKSLKVLPNFRIIISKSVEELPSAMDLKSLRTHYQDQIPFLFSVVFSETVGFYFYESISLPTHFE